MSASDGRKRASASAARSSQRAATGGTRRISTAHPPQRGHARNLFDLDVARELLADQRQVEAREVVGRHVVVLARHDQAAPQKLVTPAEQPAAERLEVRNRHDDPPARPRDARHLGDRPLRIVEVIDRALAEGGIERARAEGKRLGPGARAGDLSAPVLPLLLVGDHHPELTHALRGLDVDHPDSPLGQVLGVLAEARGGVDDAIAGSGAQRAVGHLAHAVVEELRVGIDPDREYRRVVAVQVDDTHAAHHTACGCV